MVALRKESVDRNSFAYWLPFAASLSLSARRAWIEMVIDFPLEKFAASLSARRAWIEMLNSITYANPLQSLSARRAWIEINKTVLLK